MNCGQLLRGALGAAAIAGLVLLGGPAAWAQDATPTAEDLVAPRPVHIHSGSCEELGDVVAPLTDLTAPQGDRVGQRRADLAETSFTNVPLTLDAILGADHAINAHLSAEQIGTYIACGNIGGVLNESGALVIGLGEDSDSGYTGIAFLAPAADGVSTDVSVFIARTQGGGRERRRRRRAGSHASRRLASRVATPQKATRPRPPGLPACGEPWRFHCLPNVRHWRCPRRGGGCPQHEGGFP